MRLIMTGTSEEPPVTAKDAKYMACCDHTLEHPPDCDCLDCLCDPSESIHEGKDNDVSPHHPDCCCIQCICVPCKETESECVLKANNTPEAIKEKVGVSTRNLPDCDCLECLCAPCENVERERDLKPSSITETIKAYREESCKEVLMEKSLMSPEGCECIVCRCSKCKEKLKPDIAKIVSPRFPPKVCNCVECKCLIGKPPVTTKQIPTMQDSSSSPDGPYEPETAPQKGIQLATNSTSCHASDKPCEKLPAEIPKVPPLDNNIQIENQNDYTQKENENGENFEDAISEPVAETQDMTLENEEVQNEKPEETKEAILRDNIEPENDEKILENAKVPNLENENLESQVVEEATNVEITEEVPEGIDLDKQISKEQIDNIQIENQNDYTKNENENGENFDNPISEPVAETQNENITVENEEVQNEKPEETEGADLRNDIEPQNKEEIVENVEVQGEIRNLENEDLESPIAEETRNVEITEEIPQINDLDKQISKEEIPADEVSIEQNKQVVKPTEAEQDKDILPEKEAVNITDTVQNEITEIELAIKQIQCACYEAELQSVKNALPTWETKKDPSFSKTVLELQQALSNLQSKCNEKDRVIAALTKEIKLQATCEIMNEILQRISEAYANPSQNESENISNCNCTSPNDKDSASPKTTQERFKPPENGPRQKPNDENCDCTDLANKDSISPRANKEGIKPTVDYPNQKANDDNCDCTASSDKDITKPEINKEIFKPAVNNPSQERNRSLSNHDNLIKSLEIKKEEKETINTKSCEHQDFPKCPCVFIKRPKPQEDLELSVRKQNESVLNKNRSQSRSGLKQLSCICKHGHKKVSKSKIKKPKTSHQKCSCGVRKSLTSQEIFIEKSIPTCYSCAEPMPEEPIVVSLPSTCLCDPKSSNTLSTSENVLPSNTGVDSSPLEIMEIRKISNDSLLIKWKTASHKEVIGYEILVDNVKKSKVRSRTRDAAVVYDLKMKDALNIEIYALTGLERCVPPAKAIYQP